MISGPKPTPPSGNRVPYLRLVASNSDSDIYSARANRLQAIFDRLNEANKNHSLVPGNIASLILTIMPGYCVRLDLLKYEFEKVFASTYFASKDTSAFCGKEMDVTLVITSRQEDLEIEGDPEFEASMRAMNTRREFFFIKGKEQFLALPLLGHNNRVLGAIVLYNKTEDQIDSISPEDMQIFRNYSQFIPSLLG